MSAIVAASAFAVLVLQSTVADTIPAAARNAASASAALSATNTPQGRLLTQKH